MTKEERKEKAMEYIKTHIGTSFVELKRVCFDTPEEAEGHATVDIAPNVFAWANMSNEFADMMVELKNDKAIAFLPCDVLIYLTDGVELNLPRVVDTPPPEGYDEPHWLPVTIYTMDDYKKELERLNVTLSTTVE